ncbi:arylsulfatase A family protein [Thaumarchaeota archaeon SCGC AB-539-E09]|nr:arylsulfatase A family protein [Thaumarchaeota archaeon SCGC AB-539-E09]
MMSDENVVLITIDSLRTDHIGVYGYHKETTPNLDRFAEESVIFSNAFTNGAHTAISFPSILTSAYGSMYGGYGYLSTERLSIAEWISKQGYTTAAFHSNPYLSSTYNYDKYFDVFYDSLFSKASSLSFKILIKLVELAQENKIIRNIIPYILKILRCFKPYKLPYEDAQQITQKVIRWLEKRDKKFFLWVHYMDTHWPWLSHQSLSSEKINSKDAYNIWWKMLIDPSAITNEELTNITDLYDGEIKYLDHVLGNLFNNLKKMDIYDNSIIIVTSDHGEELGDHGDIGHHNAKLYEEIIHIPLMIRFSRKKNSGKKIDNLVSLLDIAPTVADFLGSKIPDEWMGNNLIPILTNDTNEASNGVISEGKIKRGLNTLSYRSKKWKYIFNEANNKHELYAIIHDPKEKQNLSALKPNVVQKFRTIIYEHLKNTGNPISISYLKNDERLLERLKALGYME